MKLGLAAVVFSSAMIFGTGGCKVYSLGDVQRQLELQRVGGCVHAYACLDKNLDNPKTEFEAGQKITIVSVWKGCSGDEIVSVLKRERDGATVSRKVWRIEDNQSVPLLINYQLSPKSEQIERYDVLLGRDKPKVRGKPEAIVSFSVSPQPSGRYAAR